MGTRVAMLAATAQPKRTVVHERGLDFNLGPSSFYRPQSIFSRDLAVLSAVVHRRQRQQQQEDERLHVLDLLAGSGIRGARYLQQAGPDHVLCNEGDPANAACLAANLTAAVEAAAGAAGAAGSVVTAATAAGGREWRLAGQAAAGGPPLCELAQEEAGSLLARCRLEGRFFDLIDADSFGASCHLVGAALGALRWGGLVCLTSTAGTIAGGRDTASALALYGQHLAPTPSVNEQGLRSLIGLAHREALARRLVIEPLWSLYSPHGPVFRVLLRVDRPLPGRQQQQQWEASEHYGYVAHWPGSGESACCGFHSLPQLLSGGGGSGGDGGEAPLLSGPLWTGPLHSADHLRLVRAEAAARGWLEGAPEQPATRKGSVGTLGQLLDLMLGEAEAEEAAATAAAPAAASIDAALAAGGQQQQQQQQQHAARRLPPWYIKMNDVGRAGALVGAPARDKLAAELRRRGHLAVRSHIEPGALKTTATMAEAVAAAVEGLGCRSRLQAEP